MVCCAKWLYAITYPFPVGDSPVSDMSSSTTQRGAAKRKRRAQHGSAGEGVRGSSVARSGVSRDPRADGARPARPIEVGPLRSQVGYALRRAQLAVFNDIIAELAQFDLSPAKFSVLTVLHDNPGARSSDVGQALGIQKTNFVSLLDALAQRGLVDRRPSERDRRALALYLTPDGQTLLEQANRAQARHEASIVAHIGASGHARLLELLEGLTQVFTGGANDPGQTPPSSGNDDKAIDRKGQR